MLRGASTRIWSPPASPRSTSSTRSPTRPSSTQNRRSRPLTRRLRLRPRPHPPALDSAYPKVVEPAVDCAFKLFSVGLFRGEIHGSDQKFVLFKLVESLCKCAGLGEEPIELGVLRTLLAAICAKSVLAQIMVIVFTRVEEDSLNVSISRVSVNELLEFTDKNLNEGSSIFFCQNFVNEVMDANYVGPDGNKTVPSPKPKLQNGNAGGRGESGGDGDSNADGAESGDGGSKIRDDGYLLFKNLCKLSMKFSSQEHSDDQILLRGKVLSLELLKVVLDNGGPFWRNNERFLNAIKQFLCLSLLKNSALSVMAIFQLQCSIFTSLLSKFRSGLKAEIGIFFPMLVLRVLENVLQPSFLQKMTVLNLLEKISQDSQIIIDIFVNYDCDVDAPNIFERIVNGLLKTALGPPSGSTTTLSPVQDITFRHESVKCLVGIINSMGAWMDQQLSLGDSYLPKTNESDTSAEKMENQLTSNGEEGAAFDNELHPEGNPEVSDAVTLEQRRAYKIELQKGISLFNRKPSKGIEFLISTKKIGSSAEDVASFLRNNTAGLNETMIGDYLGEREEFPLKVMHAYVDSFNFKGMDFGEAIRFFLRGFRLPGEAQKIDRIMEKFAERYCKCSPNSFTSADTAYVLAYSVIMLNTDAHNNMVKDKMTKADFIRNNRGIDDGKDLPEEYLDEEKALGANGLLIKHIQEQFKAKSGKSESIYHAVTDVAILRFMVEVCWGPMLAAFSVTLDQSDDRLATSQCLQGFRHAIHVTSLMGMQTQRDAFVTSVAKFTYLHNAADMKQKNVDAVKAIISIAIEDGNHLQEAWEHILTCLSRIEHLQLLGEGAPTDASYLTGSNVETEEKTSKPIGFSSLKKKELSRIQLQRLNSEAIVAFVKALCKVSMSELQSQTDPRVFSLTKLVEIAHYNMNRIRLVWSRIWNVLSDFFVSVGLSENLSVAIFVMDSLRQLAMKFLEREELANYNFQNEFLRPFVIVMQKSGSTEIKELIVRCISQMVLSRVNHVKSGWKSVFLVFTAAAADERKNIVLLAFETMEKIVREYFPYITETETLTFTDCVKCLLTFTNSRFNSDVSLNAIAFLRFCAVKLAEGGLVYNKRSEVNVSSIPNVNEDGSDVVTFNEKDEHASFWVPLLTGLSKLTSDPRSAIRKGSLEVLFNILKDHGHLFSHSFWTAIFNSVVYPIFRDTNMKNDLSSPVSVSPRPEGSTWDSETSVVAADCLIDLFVSFFDIVRAQLPGLVSILTGLIRSPVQGPASTGVASLVRLAGEVGNRLSEDEWRQIFLALKEAATSQCLDL
ncbi:hypothetical protein L3X38_044461 [Prunus dulcis]|uniref:SEC7 domain-containing protein n=1 Tax=Prunus dulcis TaxID=3755 RepID=A0AAD4UYH0_PRUDU|nr:hypothetical protein L3X38_044461 [Prunus dulcis]